MSCSTLRRSTCAGCAAHPLRRRSACTGCAALPLRRSACTGARSGSGTAGAAADAHELIIRIHAGVADIHGATHIRANLLVEV